MKKFVALLMALVFLLTLAACGTDTASKPASGGSSSVDGETKTTDVQEDDATSPPVGEITSTDDMVVTKNPSGSSSTTITTTTTTVTTTTTTRPVVSVQDCRNAIDVWDMGEWPLQWDVADDEETVTMQFQRVYGIGKIDGANHDVDKVEILSVTINNQKCDVYQTKSRAHALEKANQWSYYGGQTIKDAFTDMNEEPVCFFMLVTPVVNAPFVSPVLDNQYAEIDLVITYRVYFSNGAITDLADTYDRKEDGGGGILCDLQPNDFS